MKTQVHLYVKNETFYTRFFGGGLWFINIFRKLPLEITVNGEAKKLKPQTEPYVYDLEPGRHEILGRDPRQMTKKADKAITGALLGAGAMAAGGGSVLAGAVLGADATQNNVFREGACSLVLKEGDIVKISCQATRKGGVVFKKIS